MKLYGEAIPRPIRAGSASSWPRRASTCRRSRIGMRQGGHKSPEHKARNSLGQVPTLELDDGTTISESVSICRYLEALHPEPPLFGVTPLEIAQIDMWLRRVEFQLLIPTGMYWRHAHPLTAALLTQHKDFGESNREIVAKSMKWLDRELADGRPFIAGETYSIADIVAQTTIDFATFIGLAVPEDVPHLTPGASGMGRGRALGPNLTCHPGRSAAKTRDRGKALVAVPARRAARLAGMTDWLGLGLRQLPVRRRRRGQ
jgi:glutathione S-transferase